MKLGGSFLSKTLQWAGTGSWHQVGCRADGACAEPVCRTLRRLLRPVQGSMQALLGNR